MNNTERELAEVLALLPCPFCGLSAAMMPATRGTGFYACCTGGNGCQASQFAMTEADAVSIWNRRPTLLSRADGGDSDPPREVPLPPLGAMGIPRQ